MSADSPIKLAHVIIFFKISFLFISSGSHILFSWIKNCTISVARFLYNILSKRLASAVLYL
jgi:hypothetical protein